MTTLIYEDVRFADHEVPPGHAERPERHAAVARALAHGELGSLPRAACPEVARDRLLLAHPEAYVAKIEAAAPEEGIVQLDPDTFMSPRSLTAARLGAGGCVAAVDAVVSGAVPTAFVASRPPGHHAERDAAMGFCLFSNAAIAALHAQDAHGLERVAVVDFDVHHGNGTQDVFWDAPGTFYASSHEWPLYPGTGEPSERGGEGVIRNATLTSGEGGRAFRKAWGDTLLPALDEFAPELIVVSAGFDAHAEDPLAGLKLREDDFAWVTAEILAVARARAQGRVVSVLEGGYDLAALATSVHAHVTALSR